MWIVRCSLRREDDENLDGHSPHLAAVGKGTIVTFQSQRDERQLHSLVRFLSRVHPGVPREVAREPELLVAVLAGQRLLRRVDLGVLVQVLRVGESLSAVAALLRGLKGAGRNHSSI